PPPAPPPDLYPLSLHDALPICHRLGVHFDSVRPNRDVDSARVPEARPRENVLVVRRLDEYLQLDRRAVGGEIVTDHLTNLQSAVDRKSTRLNSSHGSISYAVFC